LFIVAAVIALILNPAVALLQRSRLPRGLAVLTVYLTFFVAVAGIAFLLSNPIANQVKSFTHNLPSLVHEANATIITLEKDLHKVGINVKFSEQGKTALQTLQGKLSKSAGKFVSFGGGVLSEAANAAFNLILVFVLSGTCCCTDSASGASCASSCRRATAPAPMTTPRSCSTPCPATSGASCCSAS
jgi:predicted PurR-regulated permease PerM